MGLKATALYVGLFLSGSAAAQQVPSLSMCAGPDVELGTHVYRLLDRNGQEIGTVTQEWSWTDEGSMAALRRHTITTGAKQSFRIESTMEFGRSELWPLHAMVRTDTAQPSTELRRVEDRLVGHGANRNGLREAVNIQLHEPVIMPGGAVAVVPLIDWERCEFVQAYALEVPDKLAPVLFTRSEATIPLDEKMVPAYAILVEEPGTTTVVYVSRTKPRVELHRASSLGKLVWLR